MWRDKRQDGPSVVGRLGWVPSATLSPGHESPGTQAHFLLFNRACGPPSRVVLGSTVGRIQGRPPQAPLRGKNAFLFAPQAQRFDVLKVGYQGRWSRTPRTRFWFRLCSSPHARSLDKIPSYRCNVFHYDVLKVGSPRVWVKPL